MFDLHFFYLHAEDWKLTSKTEFTCSNPRFVVYFTFSYFAKLIPRKGKYVFFPRSSLVGQNPELLLVSILDVTL
jgi:hypothetical protein